MNNMSDACCKCSKVRLCLINDFNSCPKIEAATTGFGIPSKPKNVDSYIENIPFGVYMGLKHIFNIMREN